MMPAAIFYKNPCTRPRLENPGYVPFKMIEVWRGSCQGEYDIVHFDDIHGKETEIIELLMIHRCFFVLASPNGLLTHLGSNVIFITSDMSDKHHDPVPVNCLMKPHHSRLLNLETVQVKCSKLQWR